MPYIVNLMNGVDVTSADRVISYGGGVQSTAMVVLACTGRIEADVAVIANVGDDSEHPATLEYVRNVAMPWAAEQGFPMVEIQRSWRDGTPVSLWGLAHDMSRRSVPLPMRMPDSGAPGKRSCTVDFKIRPVHRWIVENRGEGEDGPATVLIGISTDEFHRASRRTTTNGELAEYPLLDLGLSRQDCMNVISRAGLPVPPKSSCFFCPFHRDQTWAEMRRDEPDLFQLSQDLEDGMIEKRLMLGRDPVYLTRHGRRLSDVIGEAQAALPGLEAFNDGKCDDGHCWT